MCKTLEVSGNLSLPLFLPPILPSYLPSRQWHVTVILFLTFVRT